VPDGLVARLKGMAEVLALEVALVQVLRTS